ITRIWLSSRRSTMIESNLESMQEGPNKQRDTRQTFIGNAGRALDAQQGFDEPSFQRMHFSNAEREMARSMSNPNHRFAEFLAAKEAVSKALEQAGVRAPSEWREIELVPDGKEWRVRIAGSPSLVALSLTRVNGYVWAVASLASAG
ncbi:MAG: 4'-phosphopantetheinyl transferase superfamily protein, partial [Planctomycetes bacterium]|nr:4'-phosphopantetheinyl transferase superfamily protein [Planctomycetota bacterium]